MHRTWIEINKRALWSNIAHYKRVIGDGLLAPVIKSNAYGHGMITIATACQESDAVSWLCVSFLSEAITLRDNGITKPILVLSYIDIDPVVAIGKNIEFVTYNIDMLNQLNAAGSSQRFPFNIHLKVDTGLSRLGVMPERAVAFINHAFSMPFIRVNGICTHFAESHKKDQEFTRLQASRFSKVLDELKKNDISIPYIHAANSAATTTIAIAGANLFRVGAGTYGLWPSLDNKALTQEQYPFFNLEPILTWKTHIIDIKTIPAGIPVGYDRTFQTERNTTIAIIPVGYYDGYDFRLHNRAKTLINGSYAPVIGRIGMNLTILDITDIPHASMNDTVIIMGNYPGLTTYELGMLAGNPNVREMAIKIHQQIPRILID